MFLKEQIPTVNVKDKLGITSNIELISGKFEGIDALEAPPNSWAKNSNNHFAVWIIHLKSRGSFMLPRTIKGINRSIYVLKNTNIELNEYSISPNSMIELFSIDNDDN